MTCKKKINVLLVYERKNREFETAVLIQEKLIKLGFNCHVTQFYWGFDFNLFGTAPDILIVPHLYNDKSVARLLARYGKPKFIINLQYEQVLSEKWENLGHHNPSGLAQNATHVCWGVTTYNRLVDFGVPKDNLLMIGAPHLDLMSNVNKDFCQKIKKKFSEDFSINLNQKWILFLSSFTYADIAPQRLKMNELVAGAKLDSFVEIHSESRNGIVSWLSDALEIYPGYVFIYRPHPDELNLGIIKDLESKFKNLHIISYGSAKQWIMASDVILSWYSTTVVESHYLNKMYQILRPFKLSNNFDSVLLKKAKFIVHKNDFIKSLASNIKSDELPLSTQEISNYYDNISGHISSDKLIDYLLFLNNYSNRQNFDVKLISLCKAKVTSLLVYFVFCLYLMTKKIKLFNILRKISFFDQWFSEFHNQFYSENELRKVKSIVDEYLIKK